MDDLNFTQKILEQAKRIKEIIDENKDDGEKVVGDKVWVWDGSYNRDKNTGKHRSGIDPLFKEMAIIIETGCEVEEINCLGKEIKLDLLLHFEEDVEIYCSSSCVKRVN